MYGSFKGLLQGTGLIYNYHGMSQYMFPDKLKSSKAKRGTPCSPAPFIPPIESKTDTYKACTVKVQISKTVLEKCTLFTGGELKKYL